MISVGEQVFDRVDESEPEKGLGLGNVVSVAGDGAEGPVLTVRFLVDGEPTEVTRDLADVARAGEVYIDARGVQMEPMPFSEALEKLWELANSNQPDPRDIAKNEDALLAVVAWQQRALDTVHDLVVNHHEAIDETFAVPLAAQPEVEGLIKVEEMTDPDDVLNAIKIVFDLGREATIDPKDAARDVNLAEELDLQNQAIDVVYDLVALHGEKLKDAITTIPTSSI